MAATQKRSTFLHKALALGVIVGALGAASGCRKSEDVGCRDPLFERPSSSPATLPVALAGVDETDEAAGKGAAAVPAPASEETPSADTAAPAVAPAQAAAVGPSGQQAEPCGTAPNGMACVPGGWFVRGMDEDAHSCDQASQPARGNVGTTPAQRVWMDTYFIDTTEVTNAAYKVCLDARECPKDGPKYTDFSAPQQPITGLSWYSAKTFCEAQGKHLQTEAEFEKAARGPDGDLQPWGNAPATCANAILMDASGRSCGAKKRGNFPDNGRVSEVAQRPAGRYGVYDLVGNAEEWVFDYWSADYATCGEACAGPNPLGPCDGVEPCEGHRYRGVRGGSWYWPAEHATGYHRRAYRPNNEPPHHFGFRCAASLVEAHRLTAAQ